jgi:hypothetical protein
MHQVVLFVSHLAIKTILAPHIKVSIAHVSHVNILEQLLIVFAERTQGSIHKSRDFLIIQINYLILGLTCVFKYFQ